MAYGRKRRFAKKRYSPRRVKKYARRTMKKMYRKQLGFGRKISNTMPKVRNRLGIFDSEMYANLSVVDMLQERMLVFAPLVSASQMRTNPGLPTELMGPNSFTPAKKICPFLVIRLNHCRDPYHSVAVPWDAIANVAGAPFNAGAQITIQTDANQQLWMDKYKGYVNGQPTFTLFDGGEDSTDTASVTGYFYPTDGTRENFLRSPAATTAAGRSNGPFVPYKGYLPQGYIKLAQAYSRAIVYESTLSVTLMNTSPIAKRTLDKNKTVPNGRHGLLPKDDGYTSQSAYFGWNYDVTPAGASNYGYAYAAPGDIRPTDTVGGYYEWSNYDVPNVLGDWGITYTEAYYSPIGISFYGSVITNAGNITTAILNLILTEDCSTTDPRFIWFGITTRKNYTSDKQSSTAISLNSVLPDYPSGIPSSLEDHQLGQETTFMLVNITDSAPAATISKTYVLKDWLGTTLTDSQHGFYTAFPGLASVNAANKRSFFPAQGLYAIVWVAPTINSGTLFSQTVYGTSPYSDVPYSENGGHQGVRPKLGYQVNTGYSDFFCCHSRIDMKCKFYEPRSLKMLQANASAGNIGDVLIPYNDANYV